MLLIKQIQQRDKQGMATNSCTEAIVVRYVFGDQSRQSRNNYTIAMEKARTLGITADKFADFLSDNGGVGKVVEKIFDFEEDEQAIAKELADTLKAEKTTRTELVGRLYSATSASVEREIVMRCSILCPCCVCCPCLEVDITPAKALNCSKPPASGAG